MGFLDKLADILDDGKINSSADKTKFKEGIKKPENNAQAAPATDAGTAAPVNNQVPAQPQASAPVSTPKEEVVYIEPGVETTVRIGFDSAIIYIDSNNQTVKLAGHGTVRVELSIRQKYDDIKKVLEADFKANCANMITSYRPQPSQIQKYTKEIEKSASYISNAIPYLTVKATSIMLNASPAPGETPML
ncbi:MAG: hypothetical protein IJ871_01375 [Ruminococcus sp.]|nr:hypothetical protein [Ruminococcus sp.]